MIQNFHKFTRIITILSQETHRRQIESKNSVINKTDGREFYRDRQRPVLWRRQAKIREKSAKWKAIQELAEASSLAGIRQMEGYSRKLAEASSLAGNLWLADDFAIPPLEYYRGM